MLGRPAVTRTGEATLIVTIEDGDDQDPTFVQDQYTAEVGFDSMLVRRSRGVFGWGGDWVMPLFG